MNTLNQMTSCTVPGYVNVLGTATNTATVSLWSKESTALYTSTTRKGDYFRGEIPVNNATGAVWLTITNIAVLSNSTGADIVTNTVGKLFVPKTAEAFSYDWDGNLTNDGRWSYTWDAENRVTSFTRNSAAPTGSRVKLDCQYDSKSRRTQKVVSTWNTSTLNYQPSTTNRFIYDGWNLIAILDATNGLVQSFTWGLDASGSLQGAGGVGGLISMTVHQGTNAGTYFYCFDGNHNVTTLLNATNGAIAAQYEYASFGELLRATGPLAFVNPFTFSTKFCDWETGFLYYGYRYYDPSTGRWLSRDPIEEQGGLTLYGFVRNDPISDFDALGKLSRQECLDKLRGLKTHIKEVKDHFSPNHCAAIRAALELFENSPCQKWAGSLDSELKDVIDVFNQFCKPGMKERKLPIPKICERCVEPKRSNVGKWIAVGALCTAGTAIIIFDIVTVPSGEGACGVVLIRYACAL